MEYLKQILQLQADGVGIREIARRIGVSRNSVRKYLLLLNTSSKADSAANDAALVQAAYTNDQLYHDTDRLQQLIYHFDYVKKELSRTGVTRLLLWKEYITEHPDGYVYSHYCYHLNHYLKNQDVSMHLEYNSGDMMMIDFAGKSSTMRILRLANK